MEVVTIEPHGFCTGVLHALALARETLAGAKGPVCALHALVHNETVCAELAAAGLRTVPSPDAIPPGATVIFSAHGVSPSVADQAVRRGWRTVDATCPFVRRAHLAVAAFAARGVPVVVIGHAAHVEVRGLVGEVEVRSGKAAVVATPDEVARLDFPADLPVGVVSQTTLAGETVEAVLAALRARYPKLAETPASAACTATRDRQRAVADFVRCGGDGVLVLGSATSSNTQRLAECARAAGARRVWCRASLEEVAACDFSDVHRLGLTSGASTPESFFTAVLEMLRKSEV